jgi:hypothetical protein
MDTFIQLLVQGLTKVMQHPSCVAVINNALAETTMDHLTVMIEKMCII